MEPKDLTRFRLNPSVPMHRVISANWSIDFSKARRTLLIWRQRAARRKALRRHLLWSDVPRIEKDIGVSPGTLTEEARKPFWRE